MSIRAKYRQATELYETGDYTSALPLFQDVVGFMADFTKAKIEQCKIGQMLADSCRMLGECFFQKGEFALAEECNNAALKLYDDPDIEAHHKPCASTNSSIYASLGD